ncbi:MAG: hypothetical protein J0L84_00495 [Verrucomicrobia bacterium]|nr:hypothetical protein [Verrucomicrobiota bacterium]
MTWRILGLAALVAATAHAETVEGRPVFVLEGASVRLVADLAGGSIGEFRFRDSELNPLRWNPPAAGDLGIRGFGHFLCLDRWGPPSDAEGARGMPYHGEAAHVRWQPVVPPHAEGASSVAEMSASLPIAGLSVRRQIRVSATSPVARVREEITNDRPLGRIYNIVQHPTIAPPFLDAATQVDCNGHRGFAQGNPMPRPAEPSFEWPAALNRDGASVDMRRLTDQAEPNVVSYAIEGPWGWVTAATAGRGLLVGYAWKTAEYPWVSLWRDVKNGQPSARGLEFGSTGLHQPYPTLVQVGRLWERPVFEFLDAGETRSKSYWMFLVKIPPDFRGVDNMAFSGPRLVLRERPGGAPREYAVDVPAELQP